MQRFRGGLVFKAHRLLFHSTLCLRVKTKKRETVPGTPDPEIRNPEPETRNPKPDTRNLKPGFRNPEPEIRNSEPETRNSEPETRNPKPETRNPKPGTRNPKPGTRNPKPGTRNPEPGTRNPKPTVLPRDSWGACRIGRRACRPKSCTSRANSPPLSASARCPPWRQHRGKF